jgi:predicted metal-dependent phosphoesterase TrpH
MPKLDLHTHSSASPDGGISAQDYRQLVKSGRLDYIAVTDHDRIDFALELQATLGNHIIVGQEITTAQGEIIGLYLKQAIPAGLSALATVQAITKQGGLVYIPHPFETVRKGMTKEVLDTLADFVDIVEVHNGRAVFQNKGAEAAAWARLHNKVGAASSDAHGSKGIGSSFTTVSENPTQLNLVKNLVSAQLSTTRPPLVSLLYPKLNRLRGKLRKTKK